MEITLTVKELEAIIDRSKDWAKRRYNYVYHKVTLHIESYGSFHDKEEELALIKKLKDEFDKENSEPTLKDFLK